MNRDLRHLVAEARRLGVDDDTSTSRSRFIDALDLLSERYQPQGEWCVEGSLRSRVVWDTRTNVAFRFLSPVLRETREACADWARAWTFAKTVGGKGLEPIFELGLDADGHVVAVVPEPGATPLSQLREGCDQAVLMRWFEELCDVVSGLHDRGVVHLNLTPDTIGIDSGGGVVLLDWREAQVLDECCQDETLEILADLEPETGRGILEVFLRGSPGFLTPERAAIDARKRQDKRSDVFLLGTLLYWLLTGKQPADPADMDGYLAQIDRRFTDLTEGDRDAIPDWLYAVCSRASAVSPIDRYADAGELLQDFTQARLGARRKRLLRRCGLLFFAVVGVVVLYFLLT